MDGLEKCPVNVVGTGLKVASNFPTRAVIMASARIASNQISKNLQSKANANQAATNQNAAYGNTFYKSVCWKYWNYGC